MFEKLAIIRKLPNGKFRVHDRKGRSMGTYPSRLKAEERLKQIEYFKHKDKKASSILISIAKELKLIGEDDLSNRVLCVLGADNSNANLSYSYIMRKLRQQDDPKRLYAFMKSFKDAFDKAFIDELEDPVNIALFSSIKAINYKDDSNEKE
jgi:hypothetical protein